MGPSSTAHQRLGLAPMAFVRAARSAVATSMPASWLLQFVLAAPAPASANSSVTMTCVFSSSPANQFQAMAKSRKACRVRGVRSYAANRSHCSARSRHSLGSLRITPVHAGKPGSGNLCVSPEAARAPLKPSRGRQTLTARPYSMLVNLICQATPARTSAAFARGSRFRSNFSSRPQSCKITFSRELCMCRPRLS